MLTKVDRIVLGKRTIEPRFVIFLILMLVWTIPQSLVVFQILNVTVVQLLFYLKNPMGVVVFVLSTVLYLKDIRIKPIFITAWFFCAYTFLAKSVQSIGAGFQFSTISSSFMYLVWVWGFGVLLPSILDTQNKLKLFLRWTLYTTIFIITLVVVLNILSGIQLYEIAGGSRSGGIRYNFGFRNPGYIGGILLAVIFGGLFLYNMSAHKLERNLLAIVMGTAFIMIYFADSRSSIMMSLVVLFVYWALSTTQHKWLVHLLGLILVSVLLYTILTIVTLDNSLVYINYTSSGRVYNWLPLIKTITSSTQNMLFGSSSDSMAWTTSFKTISGETANSLFSRFRIDNTYLDLSFQYGLPAMILFVTIFYQLLKTAFSIRRTDSLSKPDYLNLNLAISVIYGLSVYLLTTSNLPSLGNLINIVLIPSTVGSIMIAHRMTAAGVSAEKNSEIVMRSREFRKTI